RCVPVWDTLQSPLSRATPRECTLRPLRQVRLRVRPSGAAALAPLETDTEDCFGARDAAPSPIDDAEVSSVAALPLEPTVPLALPRAVERAPLPMVDADPPVPNEVLVWQRPVVAADTANIAAAAPTVTRTKVISQLLFREIYETGNNRSVRFVAGVSLYQPQ